VSVYATRPATREGRWILAALFLSGFMLFGGGLYAFVLMVPVLTDEFHWSHAASGGLVSTFWLAAPVALFGGVALQRYGPKRLLAAGVTIEAACLLAFGAASTLPTMYLLRALMGLGKVLFAVTVPVVVARYFARHFALSCAVAWAGWHAGGLVLAPLAGQLMRAHGWRTTCVVIAIGMLIIGLLPSLWALPPDSSARLGRRGGPAGKEVVADRAQQAPAHRGYRAVFGAPGFWCVAGGSICCWFVYAGALAHQSALVEESGVSGRWAAIALGSTAAFAALGTLLIGVLAERWRIARVGLVEHAFLTLGVGGLLVFAETHHPAALLVHVVFFGMAIGGCDVFWTTLLKERIGEAAFAYGYGVWYFFVVTTLLLAPIVAGSLYDASGSYTVALLVLAAAAIATGFIGLVASPRAPQRTPVSA
jgi:MFS family permease